jgi:hypothetical protein
MKYIPEMFLVECNVCMLTLSPHMDSIGAVYHPRRRELNLEKRLRSQRRYHVGIAGLFVDMKALLLFLYQHLPCIQNFTKFDVRFEIAL